MAAISQSVRVGNAVVLHLPMKYISVGECSIYSIADAVYIHFSLEEAVLNFFKKFFYSFSCVLWVIF